MQETEDAILCVCPAPQFIYGSVFTFTGLTDASFDLGCNSRYVSKAFN